MFIELGARKTKQINMHKSYKTKFEIIDATLYLEKWKSESIKWWWR